jgi:t-SNARE complex subunit (syntaxin)
MTRQIKIVDPTQSDADALKLIENGQAEQIITKALASDNLKEVVQGMFNYFITFFALFCLLFFPFHLFTPFTLSHTHSPTHPPTPPLTELRARNQELLMLQRNVEALYEMFKDLYSLIEMQGESINVIEQRVARSLDYVQRGEAELKKAKEHQKKAGKLKCILLLIFLVIAIIVLTPILITSTGGGGGE